MIDFELTQAIELACSRLVNQFAVFNDAGQYVKLADLFSENGIYARPTDPDNFVKGRDAIVAAFQARPADKLTRHLMTNIVIDVTGPDSATGIAYITLYAGSTERPAEKGGFIANASQLIGEYHDEFVRTDQGWKFAKRQGRLVFTT